MSSPFAGHFSLTLPVQDILTDDEIISDSYDVKEIDGVVYEADCKKITIGGETFGMLSPATDPFSWRIAR
jgi:hypothetical protein